VDSNQKIDPADRRIFVCDDDDSIRQMLKATLEAEGFQVSAARDGRDILKKAQEFRPHLLVTDLMMPGGGGYEVLRTLQMDEITRKIKVMVITGQSKDRSTIDMMKQEPNVVDFMEKPFHPEIFLNAVHKVLNTKNFQERNKKKEEDFPPEVKGFDLR
jgi:DNA-binding response OmpR family regulator